MSDFVINDEQPMRGTLIDTIRVVRDYINRPTPPENILIGTKTGTIITADDAFPNIPKGAKAFGKSTQDGTPTPDAPVPILSVDDLTLWLCGKNLFDKTDKTRFLNGGYFNNGIIGNSGGRAVVYIPCAGNVTYTVSRLAVLTGERFSVAYTTELPRTGVSIFGVVNAPYAQTIGENMTLNITTGTDAKYLVVWAYWSTTTDALDTLQIEVNSSTTEYAPYVGTTIPVSLDNHIMRSLPDGTCDELTFTYVEPSEREGWGVFRKTLTQKISGLDLGNKIWVKESSNDCFRTTFLDAVFQSYPLCASFSGTQIINPIVMPDNSISLGNSQRNLFLRVKSAEYYSQYDATQFKDAVNNIIMYYSMIAPITHDLGTIELPICLAPNFTFFANGGNAQPDVQISYERDITIVIDKLEAADTPVGSLSISPVINHGLEPAIQTQEETEWQSDSI